MRESISRFILKHRRIWWVVVIFFLLISGWRASRIPFNLTLLALKTTNDPAAEATEEFKETFGNSSSRIFALGIDAPDGLTVELYERIQRVTEELEGFPFVEEVVSLSNVTDLFPDEEGFAIRRLSEVFPETPEGLVELAQHIEQNPLLSGRLLSDDGKFTIVLVQLADSVDTDRERRQAIGEIQAVLAQTLQGYRYYQGGFAYVEVEYTKLIIEGVVLSQIVLLILSILVLYLFFRSAAATAIPLLVSGMSVVLTVGAMEVMGYSITLISSGVPSVIMVVAIAESTYYVARYLEQRGKGEGREEALFHALRGVLLASVATSVTTAFGFFSLYSARLEMIQDFGVILGIGTLINFVVTILLCPTLLSFVKLPPSAIRQQEAGSWVSRFISKSIDWNQRYWKTILFLSVVAFLIALIGIPRLQLEQKLYEEVREDHPVRRNYNVFIEHIRGHPSTFVSIRSPAVGALEDPEVLHKVEALEEKLMSYEGVRRVWSIVDYLKQMNWAFFEGKPEAWSIPESARLVNLYLLLMESSDLPFDAKGMIDADHRWGIVNVDIADVGSTPFIQMASEVESWGTEYLGPPFKVQFVGDFVMASRGNLELIHDMIRTFAISFLAVFLVAAIVFRSFRLTLLSIPVNLLPMLFMIGLMGWFGIALRVGTAMVLPIALGIAVNDTMHYFIRYREELSRTKYNSLEAMRCALSGSGRGILTSTMVLCVGYLALLAPEFIALNHMGIAASCALFFALLADLYLGSVLLVHFFKDKKRTP